MKKSDLNKSITLKDGDGNEVVYVREDSINSSKPVVDTAGLKLVMVRTYSAGVHYGYLKERNGKEVVLVNARRVWQWAGAASLSQLAQEGTSSPSGCKFPCEVDEITLTEAIEIIPITDKAHKTLMMVKVWKQ